MNRVARFALPIIILFMMSGYNNAPTGEVAAVPVDSGDTLAAPDVTLTFALPDGCVGKGKRSAYVVYSDSVHRHDGHNVSTIKSLNPTGNEFATILTYVMPKKALGKRVRYTAYVRADHVEEWGGLWMRIDPKRPGVDPTLGFDNMSRRAIKGTTEWMKYEIVLDVPKAANSIVYGALLSGHGQIWIDSMDIQIVKKKVPRTDTFKNAAQKTL